MSLPLNCLLSYSNAATTGTNPFCFFVSAGSTLAGTLHLVVAEAVSEVQFELLALPT